MYKCAIIGAGGARARGHAEAYRHVRRGRLAAISSRNQERLDAFGDAFGIEARYRDYREMLEKEKPDLVHVNTPPDVRLEIMQAAGEARIPGLIVEKPPACQGEDYGEILSFSRRCVCKIAVNHQLHFHPRRQDLQAFVSAGNVGEIRFIEASAGMNLAYQGTHSLQAIGAFMPKARPVSVFGQISGARGLRQTPGRHYAPDQCLASITFDDDRSAVLRCGDNAPRVGEGPVYMHKRIAVYGTRGFVHWTMRGWEKRSETCHDSGEHDYREEDIRGQASMTEAMFDWMEDDRKVHPLNLERTLRDFNVVLGIYMSALGFEVVRLPVEPQDGLIQKMREVLSSGKTA